MSLRSSALEKNDRSRRAFLLRGGSALEGSGAISCSCRYFALAHPLMGSGRAAMGQVARE